MLCDLMQVSVKLSLDERSPCELRKVDLLQRVTIWCGARCEADSVYTLSYPQSLASCIHFQENLKMASYSLMPPLSTQDLRWPSAYTPTCCCSTCKFTSGLASSPPYSVTHSPLQLTNRPAQSPFFLKNSHVPHAPLHTCNESSFSTGHLHDDRHVFHVRRHWLVSRRVSRELQSAVQGRS